MPSAPDAPALFVAYNARGVWSGDVQLVTDSQTSRYGVAARSVQHCSPQRTQLELLQKNRCQSQTAS